MKIKRPCTSCRFPTLIDAQATDAKCTDCKRGKKLDWAKSLSDEDKQKLIHKLCYGTPMTQKMQEPQDEVQVQGCEQHPKYGGIRRPRTECKTCWATYNTRKVNQND